MVEDTFKFLRSLGYSSYRSLSVYALREELNFLQNAAPGDMVTGMTSDGLSLRLMCSEGPHVWTGRESSQATQIKPKQRICSRKQGNQALRLK
jgi:hypothetical protein